LSITCPKSRKPTALAKPISVGVIAAARTDKGCDGGGGGFPRALNVKVKGSLLLLLLLLVVVVALLVAVGRLGCCCCCCEVKSGEGAARSHQAHLPPQTPTTTPATLNNGRGRHHPALRCHATIVHDSSSARPVPSPQPIALAVGPVALVVAVVPLTCHRIYRTTATAVSATS
jgi:hypothetical protein